MATLAMFTAICFWASALIVNKILLQTLAISEIAVVRFLVGAVLLWLVVLVAGHFRAVRAAGPRPLLMGLLDPGSVSLFIIWGQFYTSAVNAAVLWSLMPVVSPIAARLILKEPLRPVYAIAGPLAVGGTLVLVWGQASIGQGSPFGDSLCAIGVGCAIANSMVARRVAQAQPNPLVTTALQITAAMAMGAFVLTFIEQPDIRLLDQGADVNLLMLYVGLAGSAGPFLLYNFALRHLPLGRTALFAPLVGPLGAGLAYFVLGEALSWRGLVAIVVILVAALLPTITEHGQPKTENSA